MEDSEVVRQCLASDREAYGHLVRKYQRACLFVALRLLRDPDDAQDAVQSAFVTAYEELDRYDSARPFYPWLHTIVKNRCLKRLRQTRRQVSDDELNQHAQESSGLEMKLELQGALNRLDPQYAEILVLKHIKGLKYDEIATRLDIPRGTVMSRLHTARGKLRAVLEESS